MSKTTSEAMDDFKKSLKDLFKPIFNPICDYLLKIINAWN